MIKPMFLERLSKSPVNPAERCPPAVLSSRNPCQRSSILIVPFLYIRIRRILALYREPFTNP
jgi:hypothetical protein